MLKYSSIFPMKKKLSSFPIVKSPIIGLFVPVSKAIGWPDAKTPLGNSFILSNFAINKQSDYILLPELKIGAQPYIL